MTDLFCQSKDPSISLAGVCGAFDVLQIQMIGAKGNGLDGEALGRIRYAALNFIHKLDAHGALLALKPELSFNPDLEERLQERIGQDLVKRFGRTH